MGLFRKATVVILCLNLILQIIFSGTDTKISAQETKKYIYEGDGFTVTCTIDAEWENNYNATITITNTGSTTTDNWIISFVSRDTIDSIWNASIDSHNNNTYQIKNVGWNQDIETNKSVSFGFTASFEDKIHIPQEYIMLGNTIFMETKNYCVEVIKQTACENELVAEIKLHNISQMV